MSSQAEQAAQQQRVMQKIQALAENDPQLASLMPIDAVGKSFCAPELSLAQTMDCVFAGYGDRPALGSRDYEIVASAETGKYQRVYQPSFKTISYGQLQKRIHAVANAWKHDPVHGIKPGENICIFGFAGVEFTIIDFATAYMQAVTVPMQTGTAHMDIDEIFATIQPAVVAITAGDLAAITPHVAGKEYIRSLVVFDYDARDDADREAFATAAEFIAGVNTTLISLQELEALTGENGWRHLPPDPSGADRIVSIVHSSGSTGKAKAAMVTERAMRYYWTSLRENSPPLVSLCLAPFSHLLGKGTMITALRQGGTAYFTLAPDMSTLFEDIRIARPTFLGFFPRIIELVYQHYQNEVARRSRENHEDEATAQQHVKREMAGNYLGDRLCFAIFGGSRLSAAVRDFFVDCFDVQLMDAYGSTEGGQIALNGIVQRPPVTEYKLKDVPELGYYTTDKPHPRGEFCFKSVQSISGYYKAPKATEKLFDEDGFICTGDIVEEYEPDHIAIIDRRNDVLKLSQGEYVAVSALGTIFEGGSEVIDQIFIYGNSERSYLLAVIVPSQAIVTARLGVNPDDQDLNKLLHSELQSVARQKGIRSFEIPKDFIIEPVAFSENNGLLSGLGKKKRPALAQKYGPRLEAMYENLEQANREKRRELTNPDSTLTMEEKLIRLLQVDLNIKVVDSATSASFYELGGDSLGAVLFSRSIEEIFNVDMPADMVLSPTGNLRKWAAHIQRALSGAGGRPSFASVHGKGATEIRAAELALSKFIDADCLASAAALPESNLEARTVLLTGANGFLGRFVCLAWLEKLASLGGKVICLVRAADNTAARARLDEAYTGDPQLEARYGELARDHLDVFAADVGEERMGLNGDDYQRLVEDVDRVVHVAALVNHRFSYANLFGANVLGTAEIIRFALTERKKSIDFVSTVAVYPLLDTRNICGEDSPLLDCITLSDDYASGYGASKWAGEQLLRQASREYGLPVNIFRGDMMLPHQHYKGQINTADMFTRLLFSIIHTGVAPYSFYPLNEDGTKAVGHYDGLPVDVVAAALVGAKPKQGEYRTYNFENYHHYDGCSLDAFVDWIKAAGYAITRMGDYDAWFEAFREKLAHLSEERQQNSALEIVDAFAAPQSERPVNMNCDHFKALVSDLPIGPEVPHLTQPYIEKCLQDMYLLGLIEMRQDHD